MENIQLQLNVKIPVNDRFGNWQDAIDETYILAKQLNISCSLNYANQYVFNIEPNMSQEDINKLKESKIIIAI